MPGASRLVVLCVLISATGVKAQQATDRGRFRSFGNIALGRNITTSSTCGVNGRQQYCIVASLIDQKCFYCDATNRLERHPPSMMVDREPAVKNTWWQSENGVHNVTVQLDFETIFTFTHLVLTFKSFRPAAMVLQRSKDFGRTWSDYQYFARNCRRTYNMPEKNQNERVALDEVICTSEYSALEPSSGGEVVFSTVPPSVPIEDPYDPAVIERLSITNLRMQLDALNTLGDDLLDARPDILRKYYYGVYDWSVHGRCQCNGHAEACVPVEKAAFHPQLESVMIHGQCLCSGNTAGLNCEQCKPMYNNRAWRPRESCEVCKCYGHAESCEFSPDVYVANGYRDGGVCTNCRDNTAGNQCEVCANGYYPLPGKLLNDKDRCVACECDALGTQGNGNCAQESDVVQGTAQGDCQCKSNLIGQKCRMCKTGTWNLTAANRDGCEDCDCYTGGTMGGASECHLQTGQCMCKMYVAGRRCDECKPGYYMMRRANPDGCENCNCDPGGALDHRCNELTGQCICRDNIHRRTCTAVWPGYFFQNLDYLLYEAEYMTLSNAKLIHRIREDVVTWTGHGFTEVETGNSVTFVFNNISMTMPYHFLIRYESRLSSPSSRVMVTVTHIPGPDGFHMDTMSQLSRCNNIKAGHVQQFMVDLKASGGEGYVVYQDAICLFAKETYEVEMTFQMMNSGGGSTLIDSVVLLPTTDSVGILNDLGLLQQWDDADCYNRRLKVSSHSSRNEVCERLMFSISAIINDGAIPCECNANGSLSPICLPFEGQCSCKPGVFGRRCDACAPGHYAMSAFGCAACNCEPRGSLSLFCNPVTGQCPCRPGRSGARCDDCEQFSYYNRQTGQCTSCECDETGSASLECATNFNGTCSCRTGIGGAKCTKCLPGYYNFSSTGCSECACSGVGSLSSQCDQTSGQCECKDGVAGQRCDQCKADTFENPGIDGACQSCFCNTFSTECSAATGWFVVAKVSNFQTEFDFDGWRVDPGRLSWDSKKFLLGEPPRSSSSLTWVAPAEFLGDMRTAYTQQLQFTLRQLGGAPDGVDPPLAYVYLFRRSDPSVKLYHILTPPPSESWTQYNVPLMPGAWNRGKMTGSPPLPSELRMLLADISELRISTMYPDGYPQVSMQQALDRVRMAYASNDVSNTDGRAAATHVEQCVCPEGRIGRVCDKCARGWTRDPPNGGEFAACVKCFCFGHTNLCDPETGVCTDCQDNTEGDRCEKCKPGFYGDARMGTCKRCQCPGGSSGNQFADSCVESTECPNGVRCNCRPGYVGCQCDQCDRGYYGQPLSPGRGCYNCSCTNNGPPGDLDNCDKVTGECKVCLYNTSGDQCDRCADGFYGDASKRQCQPCGCDLTGSDHGTCDPFSGQCYCRQNVKGRTCDQCHDDHWGFSRGTGCVPCLCCQDGSVSSQCDLETGRCECRVNVGGDDDPRCCFCQSGYWNYTTTGCQACDCDGVGSQRHLCDAESGECQCRPNVIGKRCNKCRDGTSGILPYCEPCGDCYDTWLQEVDKIRAEVANLTNRAKAITHQGNLGEYEKEFEAMEAKLKEAEDIINAGMDSPDRVLMAGQKIDLARDNNLDAIRGRLGMLDMKLQTTEDRNGVVNRDLDELRGRLTSAEVDISAIEDEANRINATSLAGIIDDIRAAGDKSRDAQKRVNDSSDVVDQANDLKDRAAKQIGDDFKMKQDDNRKKLSDARVDLSKFDAVIDKANKEICGRMGDDCGTCGGVGCGGMCGGDGCPGAVNRTLVAQRNADEADLLVAMKLNETDDIEMQLGAARQMTTQAEGDAQQAVDKAKNAEVMAMVLYKNASALLDQLRRFQDGDADRANPDNIQRQADYVLGKNPLRVELMRSLVNDSRRLLKTIDPSLVEIAELYRQLLANASLIVKNAGGSRALADLAKNYTIAIEKILAEAKTHQDGAKDGLDKAEPHVMSASSTANNALATVGETNVVKDRVSNEIGRMTPEVRDLRERANDNSEKFDSAKAAVGNAKSAVDNANDEIEVLQQELYRFIGNLNMATKDAEGAVDRARVYKLRADSLLIEVKNDQTRLQEFQQKVDQNNATIADLETEAGSLSESIGDLVRDITMKADHHASC